MTEYEKAYATALALLKKLSPDERAWLRHSMRGKVEERAFKDAYSTWMGEDWKETPETIFIVTEEDAQIAANDMIGRELTEEELYDVSKGVQAGLEDWSMIMAIAIRGVTGEG